MTELKKPNQKKSKKTLILIVCIILLIIFGIVGLVKAGYVSISINLNPAKKDSFPNLDEEDLKPDPACVKNCMENPDALFYHPDDLKSCEAICKPVAKPVIYLYPQKMQEVYVKLNYKGEIFADYPSYNRSINGWQVTAYPDGHLVNHEDGLEYSYLFWEGYPEKNIDWDLSNGFIVKGSETKQFLQETLSKMGLTPREYNEFIVYWLPKMQNNKYNLIHFADQQYTSTAQLDIEPQPDSMLRVFMVYKSLDSEINIQPQEIEPFERSGFTVVEWGGTEIK